MMEESLFLEGAEVTPGRRGGRSFEWSIVGDGVDEVGETVEEAGAVATCDGAAGEWW